eukprot:augustus_masked-scaffold_40-processed-gene-1.3-mRNA-1 protein AED:0.33 eAED:0.34 QI:0/-1/0/1/-1/1/1/0/280
MGFVRSYVRIAHEKEGPVFQYYLQRPSTKQYPNGPLPCFEHVARDHLLAQSSKISPHYFHTPTETVTGLKVEVFVNSPGNNEIKRENKLSELITQTPAKDLTLLVRTDQGQMVNLGAINLTRDLTKAHKLSLCIPWLRKLGVDEEKRREYGFSLPRDPNALRKVLDKRLSGEEGEATQEKVLFGETKAPTYTEELGAYSLDFKGRVTHPSSRNFQLTIPEVSKNKVFFQFGKVADQPNEELYSLDFQFPLSPIQAFNIAIAMSVRSICRGKKAVVSTRAK